MMKHSFGLMVAFATTVLAGCQLYFGDDRDDGGWNYCGSDGYYECEGDDCYWRGSECPAGTGSGSTGSGGGWGSGGGSGGGFECTEDSDCAAGCYCGNGLCEEAGFCTQDSDCGTGYTCDETRSSCEPDEVQPPATCDYDSECPQGQYCAANNTCTATCSCTTDEEAQNQNFGWCDETRNTCLPGQDPAGSCAGAVTCDMAIPNCASGSVPTIIDGCFTGQCRVYAQCDLNPTCSHINDSANCLSRSADCSPVYSGTNCTKPGGGACNEGDTDCTCTSFAFASCRDKTTP